MHGNSAGPSDAQRIELFTAEGVLVKSINGADEAVWLDSERLIVSTWLRRQVGAAWEVVYGTNGEPLSESYLTFVAADQVHVIEDELAGAISNGRGFLAAPRCGGCDPGEPWHTQRSFVVWREAEGAAQELPGEEIAWSSAGDQLLVAHPLGDGPNRKSWPEIIAVPELRSVYRAPDLQEPVVLDPTWTRAAHWRDNNVNVIDLRTSESRSFETNHVGPGAWDASGRLVMVDYNSASAAAYTQDGAIEETFDNVGNSMTSSADGSTLALWYFDQIDGTNPLALIRDDSVTRVALPGPIVTMPGPQLSPSGTAVAVTVLSDPRMRMFVARL